MHPFLTDLGWSPAFQYLRMFGLSLINEEVVATLAAKTGDAHVIVHRQLNETIPQAVKKILPLVPNVVQVFGILPGALGKTHKDGVARKSALNIPLLGCDEGLMEWLDGSSLTLKTLRSPYTEIRVSEEEWYSNTRLDLPVCYATKVTAPSLVNTDEWHRVNNRQNENYRYMLSIRFQDNPTYSELVEVFNRS